MLGERARGRKDSPPHGGGFKVMVKGEEGMVFSIENRAKSCSLKLTMTKVLLSASCVSGSEDVAVAVVIFQ